MQIIGLEDMIELEMLLETLIPLEKYSISEEISNEICPCYDDERANDKIMVQNNNDELKSLKITVLFPSNIYDLPPSVSTFLDEYAAMLKENSYLEVEVSGHTDSKGSKEHNLVLSEKGVSECNGLFDSSRSRFFSIKLQRIWRRSFD